MSEELNVALRVDPKRAAVYSVHTGIFVRAAHKGKFGSFDIAQLDAPSLLNWLRSRGGNNPWAENVVGTMLQHDKPLVEEGGSPVIPF